MVNRSMEKMSIGALRILLNSTAESLRLAHVLRVEIDAKVMALGERLEELRARIAAAEAGDRRRADDKECNGGT